MASAAAERPRGETENPSTPSSDHRAEEAKTLRTFAYTTSAFVLLASEFVLVSLLASDLQSLRHEVEEMEETSLAWSPTNLLVGKTFTCLLLPLLVLLPPVFAGRRPRLAANLLLCAAGLLLLLLHLLSAVCWAATSPHPLPCLSMLLQRGAVALLLALLLTLLLATTASTWRQAARPSNRATDAARSQEYVAQVSLVVLAPWILLGDKLGNSTSDSTSDSFYAMVPISVFMMLLLVQLRHYTTSHVGYFTRRRAILHMDSFVKDFNISFLDREQRRRRQRVQRLIDNIFTLPLYPNYSPW